MLYPVVARMSVDVVRGKDVVLHYAYAVSMGILLP